MTTKPYPCPTTVKFGYLIAIRTLHTSSFNRIVIDIQVVFNSFLYSVNSCVVIVVVVNHYILNPWACP